jgi:hypothetical protein
MFAEYFFMKMVVTCNTTCFGGFFLQINKTMSYVGACEATHVPTAVCASAPAVGTDVSVGVNLDLTSHRQWCLSISGPTQLGTEDSDGTASVAVVNAAGDSFGSNQLNGARTSAVTPALQLSVPRGVYNVSVTTTGSGVPTSMRINALAVPV